MLNPSETGMYTPGVVNEVTIPTLLGICLGGTVLLVAIATVTCVCYRKRVLQAQVMLTSALRQGTSSENDSTLKRPSHVKSPGSGVPPGPTLKKSPSATSAKSPPSNKLTSPLEGHGDNGGIGENNRGEIKRCPYGNNGVAIGSSHEELVKLHAKNEKLKQHNDQIVYPPTILKEQIENSENSYNYYKENEQLNLMNSVMRTTKLGKLHFRLRHIPDKNALVVTIVRCTDLPAKDSNVGSSDPYLKLQLLPDKQHKVKTRVLRRTLDPVYNEDFTFYGINSNQVHNIALHFVVLSFDRYSRDDVIGEVICPLSNVNFNETGCQDDHQVSLIRDISPRNLKIRSQGRGELLVSLCYQPAASRLTVVVLKARNLPKIDITGLSDPYVKIYILYNGQRIAKKKTHVKKRTLNPVFNESFVFDVPCNEGLDNITLEFLVLDWDRVTKNEVIGHLELGAGGGDDYGSGRKILPAAGRHWYEVCNSPRRQIAEWHKLRE